MSASLGINTSIDICGCSKRRGSKVERSHGAPVLVCDTDWKGIAAVVRFETYGELSEIVAMGDAFKM